MVFLSLSSIRLANPTERKALKGIRSSLVLSKVGCAKGDFPNFRRKKTLKNRNGVLSASIHFRSQFRTLNLNATLLRVELHWSCIHLK